MQVIKQVLGATASKTLAHSLDVWWTRLVRVATDECLQLGVGQAVRCISELNVSLTDSADTVDEPVAACVVAAIKCGLQPALTPSRQQNPLSSQRVFKGDARVRLRDLRVLGKRGERSVDVVDRVCSHGKVNREYAAQPPLDLEFLRQSAI